MVDDKRVLEIARLTLDRGLCYDMTARITRATDGELIDFAHTLFSESVMLMCKRVGVHTESSRRLALIASVVRSGADDKALAIAVRSVFDQEAALCEALEARK